MDKSLDFYALDHSATPADAGAGIRTREPEVSVAANPTLSGVLLLHSPDNGFEGRGYG